MESIKTKHVHKTYRNLTVRINQQTEQRNKMSKPILKPTFKTYPQFNRTFAISKQSAERCKSDFPDCYHFKKSQAKECIELAERLQMGLSLLVELRNQGATLSAEQNKQYKAFRNGARYLIQQFHELAEHIENVEKSEFQPVIIDWWKSTSKEEIKGVEKNEV